MEQSGTCEERFMAFYIFSMYVFSHLFVVVTTKNETSPSQIPDRDLVSYNDFDADASASYGGIIGNKSPILYVAAVLSNTNGDLEEKMLVLGNENISKVGDREFYNAPLDRECTYYTFIRAYADSHTDSVSTCWCLSVVLFVYVTEPKVHVKQPV